MSDRAWAVCFMIVALLGVAASVLIGLSARTS
jgi:hypothetical protein